MANKKATGSNKGSRENPISIDDDTTSKASSRRAQAPESKGSRSQKQEIPTKKKGRKSKKSSFAQPSYDDSDSDVKPSREHDELRQPLVGPSDDDPFNTWKLHQTLRNGRLERRQQREELGLPSSDSEQYDDIYDKYSEEEIKPKKRGKKQTGPARKRAKLSPEHKVSSSKAMDHLMARVVDKSRRDD
ncbi:hypothetical protein F4811DRAFT_555907 [Daldinia bambusicola]|nr:hypothetical protein F4811DRAFT_555907 [Daldinia bambusicola]